MNRLFLLSAIAATALAFGACSSDDDTTTAPTVITKSGATISLDGSWDRVCGTSGSGGSETSTDSFAGSTFTVLDTFYFAGDTTCAQPDFFTVDIGGTFVVVGTATAAFGVTTVTANQITLTLTSATATPSTATAATEMLTSDGGNPEFGISTWTAGVATDVLPALVAFFGSDPIVFNDLIYVDDTVNPIRKYDSFADPPPTGTTFPTVVENQLFSTKRP